jgi:hypothetical protein
MAQKNGIEKRSNAVYIYLLLAQQKLSTFYFSLAIFFISVM